MTQMKTGAQIRQEFVDFFKARGHTFVPSSSLVPGGDATLLFTNAGMVQFKDVFLGTDQRPYTRAANSQKCMRVAGKHNDLEDVGRDNTHHTFFEMLGNWSFGDYYKPEAIAWAWELLTGLWGLPKGNLWATCFRDDQGDIPQDNEAADEWRKQPGMQNDHILFFGREDNFWEMAETGPCGPCSEIHLDRGLEYCDKQDVSGHVCQVNGDCARFLELWNLVFIQYNRLSPTELEPLPSKHVDTGLGLDRIVSVLQNTDSNYKTDLLYPMLDAVQRLTGHTESQREENLTPYRVIADHARAATFLIADGVVPGNVGRNYVCRMIIRRAARFGSKIGLDDPFLAIVAETVIDNYGDFYSELTRNRRTILESITREEQRFQRTLEGGVNRLEALLETLQSQGNQTLPGEQAFDLYATYGLPLEITRDIAQERNLDVDEGGFHQAMETHRLASGAGDVFGDHGGANLDVYRNLRDRLQEEIKLPDEGVQYDPYSRLEIEAPILAIVSQNHVLDQAQPGDQVEILLPETCFYIESGGQVSDTGTIVSSSQPDWEIRIQDMRKPAAGMIMHVGEVVSGTPSVGDLVIARVDALRRLDIMRNHTATHLLHHELHAVLGDHARQAGSLVAPDRLRFDFTHPEALSIKQIERIEAGVNRNILGDYYLSIAFKPLSKAIEQGAIALFGEKYSETVRNITIGEPEPFSNELCGGTHVESTGDIGLFIITSEGSAAAGIRRIEAVTGRGAYDLVQRRFQALKRAASILDTSPEEVPHKTQVVLEELGSARKQLSKLRGELAITEFINQLDDVPLIAGVPVLTAKLSDADAEALRNLADRFRGRHSSGIAVLASIQNERPIIIATITDDLVKRGLHADELVKFVASPLGGGGGGRPTMAQAGGKDASELDNVLATVPNWVEEHLNS